MPDVPKPPYKLTFMYNEDTHSPVKNAQANVVCTPGENDAMTARTEQTIPLQVHTVIGAERVDTTITAYQLSPAAPITATSHGVGDMGFFGTFSADLSTTAAPKGNALPYISAAEKNLLQNDLRLAATTVINACRRGPSP
jgi:hypothetical protein